jgi:hypothetical protein
MQRAYVQRAYVQRAYVSVRMSVRRIDIYFFCSVQFVSMVSCLDVVGGAFVAKSAQFKVMAFIFRVLKPLLSII